MQRLVEPIVKFAQQGWGQSVSRCLLLSGGVILGVNATGFLITLITQTHKITDLCGTGAFVASAIATHRASCQLFNKPIINTSPSAIATACAILWGVRLGGFLFYRILQTTKDYRLDFMFKKKDEKWIVGPSAYPLKLFGFWTIQSLWGWVVMLPITVMHGSGPGVWNWQTATFFAFFVAGWLIESTADFQKLFFKNKPENKDKWIDTGLYRYSRYPNYFGEILVWWSMYGASASQGLMWTHPWMILSPVMTMFLLIGLSGIPMQEKSKNKRFGNDPQYKFYKENTSLLVPWFQTKKQQEKQQ
eukprot:TRINITY_DN6885_c0_g3_i1.p1 TRINITY_DN6885_c0_g3~~TRINITY_DN6885_c0_g3_i1.p1  ORF type:complete len:311 (-),score=19.12 TRINITY_DN6885_c0_g3_i1:99-1007(-)